MGFAKSLHGDQKRSIRGFRKRAPECKKWGEPAKQAAGMSISLTGSCQKSSPGKPVPGPKGRRKKSRKKGANLQCLSRRYIEYIVYRVSQGQHYTWAFLF
jgi:hypothetical protein